MKAITKFLAGGVAIAGLASAAPAAAQYYPGYGSPYGYGYGAPNVIGSIINGVTGYGNNGYGYNGYGYHVRGGSQVAANQCSAAVQQRLGGYGGYGYGAANGRVGIKSVEIRSGGGYRVRGTALASGYAYGGGAVHFNCRTDPRGYVVDVDFNNRAYGYGNGNGYYGNGYYGSNYNNPYSAYGYQRY